MKLTKAQETSPHPCIGHQWLSFGIYEGFGLSSPFPETSSKGVLQDLGCVSGTQSVFLYLRKESLKPSHINRMATWFVSSVPLVNAGWERGHLFDGLSGRMSRKPAVLLCRSSVRLDGHFQLSVSGELGSVHSRTFGVTQIEFCGDGWPTGTFSHLHTGSLELSQCEHWVLGHVSPWSPAGDTDTCSSFQVTSIQLNLTQKKDKEWLQMSRYPHPGCNECRSPSRSVNSSRQTFSTSTPKDKGVALSHLSMRKYLDAAT